MKRKFTGIQFSQNCIQDFSSDTKYFACEDPFDETDITGIYIYGIVKTDYLGIVPKIKHTNLSAHSKGFVLKSKAEAESANTRHSFHLLKQSIREFEAGLAVDTTNKITLR